MPYVGSYVWSVRQKVGHDILLVPSADVVAVDEAGRLLTVFNKDWNNWFFPGGYAEVGQTAEECAVRELLEEGGLRSEPRDLVPFAFASGHTAKYANGDIAQPFTQCFIVKKWQDTGEGLDTEEVSQRRWISLDELKSMDLIGSTRKVIAAYEEYERTHEYQTLQLSGVTINRR